ncbi:FAD-dependent monooxygenase [Novosphingobium sp. BW1]|uniref:FAD binding domain-containing protein n=1 Tax=Novosphingobium sp. BW1 TaxID=2592621 RepID=UPI0019678E02|nr:FAD-dependent monooxygenase [Novosphingobium sp. BW1]
MRIAIAGGSMAGLFAAALLQRSGHEVHVFERSVAGLEGRGAGLVAQEDIYAILHGLGLGHIAGLGVVARERITLRRDGSIARHDPHPQMQMSWDLLFRSLRDTLAPGTYCKAQAVRAAGTSEQGAWLRFEDGTRLEADLVVGAEGLASVVREAVLGDDDAPPRFAGYVAWRALLPEDQLSADTFEILSDRFAFYHMPGGQVLGYTVAGLSGEQEIGGEALQLRLVPAGCTVGGCADRPRRASPPLSSTARGGLGSGENRAVP